MKIRVLRKNGEVETIILRGRLEIVDGEYMNRITVVSGLRFDHYFTHDGFYDGWGGAVSCNEETALESIQIMERKRKTETN